MARAIYKHPWKVVCPDGRTRAYRAVTKKVALDIAFGKTADGCKSFPDDPSRWREKPCPQGTHQVMRIRKRG